jgi:predicted amidohydrolase YtcJ
MKTAADTVFYNANVLTMDPSLPRAEAVAIRRGMIVYVGESSQALSYGDSLTHVIDCRGRTILPGFNDNHVHALGMGNFYLRPNLYGKSCDEIVRMLKREYAGIKPGRTIMAQAWDYPFCPDPSKGLLDRAFPHNPVMLFQYSGHAVWVNSVMLKRMRIHKNSPDPKGGLILRGADGEPTGIIRGSVLSTQHRNRILQRVLLPRVHHKLLDTALEKLRACGVTSVQDNTWQPVTVWLLHRYKRQGKLTCRFSCWPFGQVPLLAHSMRLARYDRRWIRRGPWKYVVDGAFSPHSAWLMEPYEGEPDNRGKATLEPQKLEQVVKQAALHGRQLAFHAIGDRAVHEVINAVEKTAVTRPWVTRLRLRLEHAQLILPEDIPRMKRLGILAAAQPTALSQPEKDFRMLGKERFNLIYAYKSLLDAGVHLSFGSDIPGENEYRPLEAIRRAVTRSGDPVMPRGGKRTSAPGRAVGKNAGGGAAYGTISGPAGYNLKEKISVEQALYCYTMGSAYAEFTEHVKGSLVPGKLADLVMLTEDPTRVDPQKISEISVCMTVVGGRIVYQADLYF